MLLDMGDAFFKKHAKTVDQVDKSIVLPWFSLLQRRFHQTKKPEHYEAALSLLKENEKAFPRKIEYYNGLIRARLDVLRDKSDLTDEFVKKELNLFLAEGFEMINYCHSNVESEYYSILNHIEALITIIVKFRGNEPIQVDDLKGSLEALDFKGPIENAAQLT